jgi:hypothetical protein
LQEKALQLPGTQPVETLDTVRRLLVKERYGNKLNWILVLFNVLFKALPSNAYISTPFLSVLRIRDVYTRSEVFHPGSRFKKIPDPGSGSASKNLSIFNPKNYF